MSQVANTYPYWLGQVPSANNPVVAFAGEVSLTGGATGALFTTTTVFPAGTYLVGMATTVSGTFISTDNLFFRIIDTAFGATTNPEFSPVLINLSGGLSYGTMSGLLIFPVASTIQFRCNGSFTNAGTVTIRAEGGYIQKIV
tara:strand:+ start:22 stop:447 length:426 start_codon:yes stop_codon:yes gene_type:complete